MGWSVHEAESSEAAARLMSQACAVANVRKDQLTLHADNGGPMKGATMLATLQKLGVMPSFSRPGVSDDNPFSEALFRTLKYVPWYPSQAFETVEAARSWVERFVRWYNGEHLHSGIAYVTPNARHKGEDKAQLQKRRAVYERARARHPERWSGPTRTWECVGEVSLNARKPRKSRHCDASREALTGARESPHSNKLPHRPLVGSRALETSLSRRKEISFG